MAEILQFSHIRISLSDFGKLCETIPCSCAEPNGGWDDIPIGITCIDRHLYSVLSQSLL